MNDRNYFRDSRVIAASVQQAYTVVESNEATTTVELSEGCLESLVDDELLVEGHDGKFTAATKFAVCGACRGSGKTVNPAIDADGISAEEFRADPDFEADYFAGRYDIQCAGCKGARVVADIEFPSEVHRAILEWQKGEWAYAQECAAERAEGA